MCVTIDGLKGPGKTYIFRTRFRGDRGWGVWSKSSAANTTAAAAFGNTLGPEALARGLAQHAQQEGARQRRPAAAATTMAVAAATQHETNLETLMALGFHAALCEEALSRSAGDLHAAAEDLSSRAGTDHSPEEAEPPPPQEPPSAPEGTPSPRRQHRGRPEPEPEPESGARAWARLCVQGNNTAVILREVVFPPIILVLFCCHVAEIKLLSVSGLIYLKALNDSLRREANHLVLVGWCDYRLKGHCFSLRVLRVICE